MTTQQKTPRERFQETIGQHQLTIIHDDGLHRHLRCAAPGTNDRYFNITTWPGFLCISGDMGCYVFQRIEDMFAFFRNDEMGINPGYWEEKLQAGPSIAPDEITKEWVPEKFRSEITEWFNDATEDWSEEDKAEAWEAVEEEVLIEETEGEQASIRAALEFRFNDKELFQDFWEVDCKKWKGHYIWCCYAIVWAIQQYDAQKAAA
ncbi:hypothetical protein HW452_16760 [Halomonas aquamarina]|uniref:Uncharacterized protein n=1 Tax=Vreelandella aquamarina TaxID=77097 RepID=A0ACC5VYC6_9GAMM|nr:hypothetical protein [Halomonas aquamarina]MBZ5489173.1 hypothetical protein [Halomonas aquamarina]